MPNIKPVSDLRNYNEILKDVSTGSPIYLTKNDRNELDHLKAVNQLFSELQKGEISEREHGWISANDVEAKLELI